VEVSDFFVLVTPLFILSLRFWTCTEPAFALMGIFDPASPFWSICFSFTLDDFLRSLQIFRNNGAPLLTVLVYCYSR